MAAMIEYVCVAEHGVRADPSITLEQRAWAFCASGASDSHEWAHIDPTAVEIVRSRPSTGRPHLAPSESDEGSLTHTPGR
jgi:hypothetical protein